METLKKHFFKISSMVGALALTATTFASAAVDSDLTTALASSTALATDNKSTIITFIVGLVGITLVIALGKVGVYKAKGMIIKAFKR